MYDSVILTKGCLATAARRERVERIIAALPGSEVIERLDVPHNKIAVPGENDPARVSQGKRTLVVGVHGSAVRRSAESGNACPNYWHFSPYGFCFYGCKYCYLAGTTGVWHSPTVRAFVNLDEIVSGIDREARRLGRPTAFYLGKLQDGLALDGLTGYSEVLVPFFGRHPFARQTVLTKCDCVSQLLGLDHRGHTILSWSVNPPEIVSEFEDNTPAIESRLEAMLSAAAAGYPVRAVLMPMIPAAGWEECYSAFVAHLLETVPVSRLTVGGICIYKNARRLMESRLGRDNAVSRHIDDTRKSGDGRARYTPELRSRMYRLVIETARAVRPDIELALCLEEPEVWKAMGIEGSMGKCNCVL